MFWCGINRYIDDMVELCAPCQTHQPANRKEPLIHHDVPKHAWHTLERYIMYTNRRLLQQIPDRTKAQQCQFDDRVQPPTRNHRRARHPTKNYVRQLPPKQLKIRHQIYGIEHVTSSPLFPQSNGCIERTVQTIKRMLTKARETCSDPHLAMLRLRTTQVDHNLPYPSEQLNGRQYKSNLPTV